MKKVIFTVTLLIIVSNASAGTWIGVGNYIPSQDTTYGILSTLTPKVVALRFGKNILFEPAVTASFRHLENRTPVPGIDTFDVDFSHFGLDLKGYFPLFQSNSLVIYPFGGIGFFTETDKTTYRQDFGGILSGDYDKTKTIGFRVPLGVALQYRLSNYVSLGVDLESSFYYAKSSAEEKRGNTTTDLGSDSEYGVLIQNQVIRLMLFFGLN